MQHRLRFSTVQISDNRFAVMASPFQEESERVYTARTSEQASEVKAMLELDSPRTVEEAETLVDNFTSF